ncbi:MAG: nitronate monooxygenase [Geminicoccaceae bacterium]
MAISSKHDRLDHLWHRGRHFLGTELAVMAGAMTWVSERNLVAAISDAGGFGVLACGSMGPERLSEEITATAGLTNRPFGVNLIVMHPQLDELVGVCLEQKVTHVVLAGGLPPREAMQRLKTGGVKVVCFAPSLALAKKLVRSGADALVIEGMEAGGHIGPVSTSVLAQEILPFVTEVPVFVAGGIGHGEMIAAYLQMGAAGVQMGTVFVCAEESTAHPAFKQAFVRGAARDAVPSVQIDPEFKVIPVRALANAGTRRFTETQIEVIGKFRSGQMTFEEASLAIEHYWAGALRKAVVDGDVENGSLMAGQSVGLVRKIQPVRAILADLVEQAERALARRAEDPLPATPVS